MNQNSKKDDVVKNLITIVRYNECCFGAERKKNDTDKLHITR